MLTIHHIIEWDCGVFLCFLTDFASTNTPIGFNQDHISESGRECIALSIMTNLLQNSFGRSECLCGDILDKIDEDVPPHSADEKKEEDKNIKDTNHTPPLDGVIEDKNDKAGERKSTDEDEVLEKKKKTSTNKNNNNDKNKKKIVYNLESLYGLDKINEDVPPNPTDENKNNNNTFHYLSYSSSSDDSIEDKDDSDYVNVEEDEDEEEKVEAEDEDEEEEEKDEEEEE
jgi:hypothetical protein